MRNQGNDAAMSARHGFIAGTELAIARQNAHISRVDTRTDDLAALYFL
jgi:hypothetical protein